MFRHLIDNFPVGGVGCWEIHYEQKDIEIDMGIIIKHEGNALELLELTEGQETELAELRVKKEAKRDLPQKDTLCANCLEPILWIKHGWPLSMVEKIGGCCCSNSKCKFYCVFIPNRIADNLTINQKR